MKLSPFCQEISDTLSGNGINVSVSGCGETTLLHATGKDGHGAVFLVLDPVAGTEAEADRTAGEILSGLRQIQASEGLRPAVIVRDLWERQKETVLARMLAHCGTFTPLFARNCEVRRISRPEANAFLAGIHSYGGASCRYCYGLFPKKAAGTGESGRQDGPVAVAEFSNARKWIKSGQEIRSYEWIRYASLPGMRISGGMGKILRYFTDEIRPDDIMSYADLEWSDGSVYRRLGFAEDGFKSPVTFLIDRTLWTRTPISCHPGRPCHPDHPRHPVRPCHSDHPRHPERPSPVILSDSEESATPTTSYYRNLGSIKFRLKLTDY